MGKLVKLTIDEHRKRGTLRATEYPAGAGLHLASVCQIFDAPLVDVSDPT